MPYPFQEALKNARTVAPKRKFTESIDIIFKMGIDPTQSDQNVRGMCIMPSGTGKEVKVCVFANELMHP
jgi:large subunit ribosomal protein L1